MMKLDEASKTSESHAERGWVFAWLTLAVILALVTLFRVRMLGLPLERDEGEYAYVAQQMLRGVPPYLETYSMKLPGIYAIYALFLAIFGESTEAIHLGFLLTNLATIVLVFVLARKLFGLAAAVASAASYALLSAGWAVYGTAAHATHFVVAPALGGILFLLRGIDHRRHIDLFWSGLLMGVAFTMKQPGILFAAFGLFYLTYTVLRERPLPWPSYLKSCSLFALGTCIPYGLVCLLSYASGAFDNFWFWTVSYARLYSTALTLAEGLYGLLGGTLKLATASPFIWGLFIVGLSALIWDKKVRSRAVFILAFFVFSFLATSAGLYFRGHYFVLLLPACALLVGAAIHAIGRWSEHSTSTRRVTASIVILAAACAHTVFVQRDYLFSMDPFHVSRMLYGTNPFPEAEKIADYVNKHSLPSDTIAVVGSEPEIYFYARRRAATSYLYTYPLMEEHSYALKMQREMIRQIEKARPRYIVKVCISTSWLIGFNSETVIFDWMEMYCLDHYRKVGLVELMDIDRVIYTWGAKAESRLPESDEKVVIYERREPSH